MMFKNISKFLEIPFCCCEVMCPRGGKRNIYLCGKFNDIKSNFSNFTIVTKGLNLNVVIFEMVRGNRMQDS